MIYFDNAATSYMRPPEVAQAVADAICRMGNSSRGTYAQAMDAGRMLLETRQLVADLVNAEGPDCVAFTMNATHGLNLAIQGTIRPGDYLITSVLEHNSVLRPAYLMEERGVHLSIAGCDAEGRLDLTDLEKKLKAAAENRDRDALAVRGAGLTGGGAAEKSTDHFCREMDMPRLVVVITHVSNLTGNVTDLRAVGSLCRRYEARLVVDASQGMGILPIDMQRDQIDILCFTGHKALMGPQGTGGIVAGRGIEIEPVFTGGSGIKTFLKHMPEKMPEKLEAGTQNVHSIAGLNAALKHMLEQGRQLLQREYEDGSAALEKPNREEGAEMQTSHMLSKQQKLEGRGYAGDRQALLCAQAAYAAREEALRRQFLHGIRQLNLCLQEQYGVNDFLRVYGAQAEDGHGAILPLNVGEEDSAVISDILSEEYGIATRSGGHCAPLMHKHFGTVEQGMVRFSFSHYNTQEEVQAALAALEELALDYAADAPHGEN